MIYKMMAMITVALMPLQRTRDERGLSQSTENAILLTAAVAIAVTLTGLVLAYVTKKLGAGLK